MDFRKFNEEYAYPIEVRGDVQSAIAAYLATQDGGDIDWDDDIQRNDLIAAVKQSLRDNNVSDFPSDGKLQIAAEMGVLDYGRTHDWTDAVSIWDGLSVVFNLMSPFLDIIAGKGEMGASAVDDIYVNGRKVFDMFFVNAGSLTVNLAGQKDEVRNSSVLCRIRTNQ